MKIILSNTDWSKIAELDYLLHLALTSFTNLFSYFYNSFSVLRSNTIFTHLWIVQIGLIPFLQNTINLIQCFQNNILFKYSYLLPILLKRIVFGLHELYSYDLSKGCQNHGLDFYESIRFHFRVQTTATLKRSKYTALVLCNLRYTSVSFCCFLGCTSIAVFWELFDAAGEVKTAAESFLGNACSRVYMPSIPSTTLK